MASPFGVIYEPEGSGEMKEVGKRKVRKDLTIEIWSKNMATLV